MRIKQNTVLLLAVSIAFGVAGSPVFTGAPTGMGDVRPVSAGASVSDQADTFYGEGDEALARELSGDPETREFRRGYRDYDGVQDTYLMANEEPSSPHGGPMEQKTHIKGSSWGTKRALLQFDLTEIPHYMDVTEARLELYLCERYPDNPAPVSFYHLLRPWDELTATWDTTGTEPWSVSGARGAGTDYDSSAFATATLPTTNGYHSIDITDAVQRWVEEPNSNNGFIIVGNSATDVRFWSSDSPRLDDRPRLIVTYELPPGVTPEPTHTPTHTPTPTLGPTSTPTPANVVTSWGLTEAFGAAYPNCIQAGPLAGDPDTTHVFLAWQGEPKQASLGFWYSGNNDRHHSVLVNDQIIGQLPGENYKSVCTSGTYGELPFDPAIVVSGENKISIVADVPGETNSWGLQSPKLHLGGNVQSTEIEVVELTSSYDGTTQRAMTQKPIGWYAPGASESGFPLVIALHGWGERDFDSLRWFALACNRRGWLLACPDTRNSNQHTPSEAVQHDVLDLIDYMVGEREKYGADPNRVYIWGPSMGGMMAATVAAKYPDRFAALAEEKGPTRLDRWYWEVEAWRQEQIASELNGSPYVTPFSYLRVSAEAMPMNLRNVPTVIIHGRDDQLVPFHHAEDLRIGIETYGGNVALHAYDGGHGDYHPEWNPDRILSFFSEHTLDTCPVTVTVRADEPHTYYWLTISYSTYDHWTQVNASLDRESKTISVEVFDENQIAVNVTLDLERMGLPRGVAYTIEDLNVDTGSFAQYTVEADAQSLRLSLSGDHHKLVAYPFAASTPHSVELQQGEGYSGVSDTYIEIYSGSANHADDGLQISSGGARAPLLRFDLTDLPPSAVIKGGQLGLYATYKSPSDASVETSAYRLLQSWDVHQVTWLERLSGVSWAEPGAMGAGVDRETDATSSQVLDSAGEWYYYNVTDLVRQWASDGGSNHGLLIRGEGKGSISVNSSESSWNGPKLVIKYADATATPTSTTTPTSTPSATPSATVWATASPTALPGLERVYLPAILK